MGIFVGNGKTLVSTSEDSACSIKSWEPDKGLLSFRYEIDGNAQVKLGLVPMVDRDSNLIISMAAPGLAVSITLGDKTNFIVTTNQGILINPATGSMSTGYKFKDANQLSLGDSVVFRGASGEFSSRAISKIELVGVSLLKNTKVKSIRTKGESIFCLDGVLFKRC